MKLGKLIQNEHGIANIIIGLVVAMVVMIVGLFAFASVQDAMPTLDNEVARSAMDNIVSASYEVWGMVPTILIVVVVGAILSIVIGLGMSRRR